MKDQGKARAFVKEMEDKYDFGSGAIGTGKTTIMPMPTQKELESMIVFGGSCPECGKKIFIEYQDNSVAHTIILNCKNCNLTENVTDFDSW